MLSEPERHPDLPIRLRAEGCARWFGAAFLAFWLCGWVAGEVFATAGLVGAAGQLLAKGPGAVALGLFLLFWLSLWTLGGVGAIRELLRLIWAEDELSVDERAIVLTTRVGPWRKTRRFEREDVRSVRLRERDKSLVVETQREGEVVLTTLGSVEKRTELRGLLHALLELPDEVAEREEDAIALPAGWESRKESEAVTVLAVDRKTRRGQTGCTTVLFTILGASLAATVLTAKGSLAGGALTLAVLLAVSVVLVGAGLLWLALGSTEYVLETRRFTRRRRFLGRTWLRTFEPVSLLLRKSTDSDGDHHYKLVATSPGAELVVETDLNESRKLVHLGRWIGARVGSQLETGTD
ncbi:MAG: hypothetical protein ACAI25_19020 [Planctomycetota bacterium]